MDTDECRQCIHLIWQMKTNLPSHQIKITVKCTAYMVYEFYIILWSRYFGILISYLVPLIDIVWFSKIWSQIETNILIISLMFMAGTNYSYWDFCVY